MAQETRHRFRWLSPAAAAAGDFDEELVRQVLLDQHDRLRLLLTSLDARAVAVIRLPSPGGPQLRSALDNTAQALDDHIRGEERAVTILLPRTEAGQAAAAHLRAEHARQREEVACMRRRAASCDDVISLALAVRAFVADVRLDMDLEEERYLSSPWAMSERT